MTWDKTLYPKPGWNLDKHYDNIWNWCWAKYPYHSCCTENFWKISISKGKKYFFFQFHAKLAICFSHETKRFDPHGTKRLPLDILQHVVLKYYLNKLNSIFKLKPYLYGILFWPTWSNSTGSRTLFMWCVAFLVKLWPFLWKCCKIWYQQS